MPRVTFIRDFDFRAAPGVILANKAGQSGVLVTTAHAKSAVEAGAATYVKSFEPRQAGAKAGCNPGRAAQGDP